MTMEYTSVIYPVGYKSKEKGRLTIDQIFRAVSYYFSGIDMTKKCRERKYVYPRQLFCIISLKESNETLKVIGAYLGGQDHTSVIHACNTARDLLETDEKVVADFDNIMDILNNKQ